MVTVVRPPWGLPWSFHDNFPQTTTTTTVSFQLFALYFREQPRTRGCEGGKTGRLFSCSPPLELLSRGGRRHDARLMAHVICEPERLVRGDDWDDGDEGRGKRRSQHRTAADRLAR